MMDNQSSQNEINDNAQNLYKESSGPDNESYELGSKNITKVNQDYLEQNGINPHKFKEEYIGNNNGSLYDIYRDKDTGELWIYRKNGVGEGIPTGVYIERK